MQAGLVFESFLKDRWHEKKHVIWAVLNHCKASSFLEAYGREQQLQRHQFSQRVNQRYALNIRHATFANVSRIFTFVVTNIASVTCSTSTARSDLQ